MTVIEYTYFPILNRKWNIKTCIQPVNKPRWKFYVIL